MYYINAYNVASEGAKELSAALGALRIKAEGSRFKGNKNKVVINWGSRKASEEVMNSRVLNPPEKVELCANKLSFFKFITDHNNQSVDFVSIPPWTDNVKVVEDWLDNNYTAVCRTILNGHSGAGIVIFSPRDWNDEPIPRAPLYTRYIPKKSEFRVHVMNNEVIDVQRKARNKDVPDDQINWKVRNHDNGFIYARNDGLGNVPKVVTYQALLCIKVLGLDFGAVDIIYNDKHDEAYVLEVNTAPGLAGQTSEIYAEAFKRNYS